MWHGPRGQKFRSASTGRKQLGPNVTLTRVWQPGLVDVGPVTIHDLRHTYASWILQQGVTIEALCDLLGHSSILVTQGYAHLQQTEWDRVRDALDAISAPHLPPTVAEPINEDQHFPGLRRSSG